MEITPRIIPALNVFPAKAGTSTAKQTLPTVIASLTPKAEGVAISVTSTCHMKEMLQMIYWDCHVTPLLAKTNEGARHPIPVPSNFSPLVGEM